MAYSEVTIIGYNANPPPDDGTEVSLNEIAWAKHIDKIGDPLKTAIEAIDDNMKAFSDESPSGQSGTLMLFQQTTAPTGWTKDLTHNDKALRVVTGTASSAGTSPFSTVFGQQATEGHALTTGELASHTHGPGTLTDSFTPTASGQTIISARNGSNVSVVDSGTGFGVYATVQQNAADTIILSLSGATGSTGSGTAHTHPMEMRVQYVDIILASKD